MLMRSKYMVEAICALLVLLFVYTATSKLINFDSFWFDMNNQPFPNELTPYLVLFIPATEILIAISLVYGPTRKIGLLATVVLMSLFTLYTGLVLAGAFPQTPCSCGGVIRSLTWPQHLVFNIFFVFISIIALRLYKKQIPQPTSKPLLQ